jgi:TolB-like protein
LRYAFEDLVLDTGRRELRRGLVVVAVTRQVFDILEYLVRNRGRVVSKDDLIGAIWSGRAVSDSALTTRLNAARHAVGDSGDQQRLIKTLPRTGYRFVAAVREGEESESTAVLGVGSELPIPPAVSNGASIAVLPFVDTIASPEAEGVAGGFAEAMLTALGKIHWLHVSARKAGFAHAQTADTCQIGIALGVRYVLEGSVRHRGARVRIAGRLVDVAAGVHVWSSRYDRSSADIFAVQDEIAEVMAAEIGRAMVQTERLRAIRMLPEKLGAWEAYQLGMWRMSQCDPAENLVAQACFKRAIDIDPAYAPSYGALGWSYMMAASIYSQMSIFEGCALGEPLVRKAIALDENDLEARARLSIVALLQGDLEGAFEGARDVLAVDPACAEALGVKGTALLYSGRREEGRLAILQHLELSPHDPARPIRLSQIAASLYLDGRYELAAMMARRVIRQYRNHPTAYRWLAASLGQLGRAAEAKEVLETLHTNAPSSFDMYIKQRPKYCSIEYAPMVAGLHKAGWKG